ncbi:MAG TPA: OsmC family protein [Clostridia bacterium]|nr:OsmC family protein [Clostridia bacterium]
MTTMATMPKEKITNGVNVTKLAETIRAVRQQPELADFKFRARNKWFTGGQNQAEISDYYGTCQEMQSREKPFTMDLDEPPVLLGEDKGPNPVEVLLAALSGCMTTTLAYHAASRGLNLQKVESEYEGDIDLNGFLDIDPNVRKGYQEIRVKFRVKGDADAEKVRELVQKSPVFDSISKGVPIKIMVETV